MATSNDDKMLNEGDSELFYPSENFQKNALINNNELYNMAKTDGIDFWEKMAEGLKWFRKWETVFDGSNPPYYQWFTEGKLNVSYNCLDRHIDEGRGDKRAIVFEGEKSDVVSLTYKELLVEVCKAANVLKQMGIGKGDTVTIWMPMLPETVITMLACTRIGAVHSVVFGGYSPEALRDRIDASGSKLLVTANGSNRKGKEFPMITNAGTIIDECPSLEKVIVLKRTDTPFELKPGRDHLWDELMNNTEESCSPEEMDAEDPLFILYSSGTTGKPKGILHTTGGYLVGVNTTFRYVFDYKDDDIYWCTADIGWITGHSYVVYGPLSCGATVFIYEGTPDYPARDRFWELIEKYKITILYTAPTAIRTFMRWGEDLPAARDLSSLRLLGSVGEPINPEAWLWFYKHIGNERCPIVDTWWQTETGMIIISPLPGVTPMKPGSATFPFPGVEVDVVDDDGNSAPPEQRGYLVIKTPWPSMLRTLYNDNERYEQTYWSQFPGLYFTGDGAMKDSDDYIWIMGRVDDILNISGHRIGTMEVESALVDHPAVAESAVIGKEDPVKGQSISAFVTLKEKYEGSDDLVDQLKQHVVKKIGAIARPGEVFFTVELPKTRSGKIMRRLLRDIAEGRRLGDVTTLMDPNVIEEIKNKYSS